MEPDLAGVVDGVPERFVAEEMHGQIVEAEHLSRYRWAAALGTGKRVLDAGCGTAYGSVILAEAGADEVIGVDTAADVLEAVRSRMPEGVLLQEADVSRLPYDDGSFDVVVCFEVIEHVDDAQRVLDELSRVLAEGGVLAVSSPNRDVYAPGNPHHRHEFVPDELEQTLKKRFANVRLFRQADWIASAVLDDRLHAFGGDERLGEIELHKSAAGKPGDELYTLALAGNAALPEPPAIATLSSAAEIKAVDESRAQLERERGELARRTLHAEHRADEANRDTRAVGKRLLEAETELARARQAAARHADDLEREHGQREAFEARLAEADRTIREMQEARIWRIGTGFWRLRDRLLRRRSA